MTFAGHHVKLARHGFARKQEWKQMCIRDRRIGDRIFKLKRIRSADNMPMMVERSYLPVRQFLYLKRPLLERKPLYDVIEQDFQQKIDVYKRQGTGGVQPISRGPLCCRCARGRLHPGVCPGPGAVSYTHLDARVGACPKCGKDLVMKTSAKTRGS